MNITIYAKRVHITLYIKRCDEDKAPESLSWVFWVCLNAVMSLCEREAEGNSMGTQKEGYVRKGAEIQ